MGGLPPHRRGIRSAQRAHPHLQPRCRPQFQPRVGVARLQRVISSPQNPTGRFPPSRQNHPTRFTPNGHLEFGTSVTTRCHWPGNEGIPGLRSRSRLRNPSRELPSDRHKRAQKTNPTRRNGWDSCETGAGASSDPGVQLPPVRFGSAGGVFALGVRHAAVASTAGEANSGARPVTLGAESDFETGRFLVRTLPVSRAEADFVHATAAARFRRNSTGRESPA